MAEILIDDGDYEPPQLAPCKVRIGGVIYEVAPKDDRSIEALLEVANDLMASDKAVEALVRCLSRKDAADVMMRLAEGEESAGAEDDDDSRVTKGRIRYVVQKLIVHYEDDIAAHFRSLSKRAVSARNNGDKRPSAPARSTAEATRRTARKR